MISKLQNLLLATLILPLFVGPAWAGIVDGESRLAPAEFFSSTITHPKEASYAASGSLYCGLAGIDVTAQVVVENDLLLTAAHFFFKLQDPQRPQAMPLRDNLQGCFFTSFFGPAAGKRINLRLDTLRFYAARGSDALLKFSYHESWKKDLALVRLDLSKYPNINFSAYNLSASEPNATLPDVHTLLTAVDGGSKSTYDFSPALQMCKVRDMQKNSEGALPILYTDCDVQNAGPSGAALLKVNGERLEVQAILTGHYHSKTGEYSRQQNSTLFVYLDAQAKSWISRYLEEIR